MRRTSIPLLEVKNLTTYFDTQAGLIKAVDDVSFNIEAGEILGLVGESGCGKSVTALSLMRLVPDPPGKIIRGQVILDGVDLLQISDAEIRHIRGRRIAMIFQEPMTSLNPVLTIGRQLTEPLELHLNMTRREAATRAAELIDMVGIPDPDERLRNYPHHLSGGMRQRIMIAMALSCDPALLIADEATTALDVTIQAQILELMQGLTSRLNTALLIITHNLGVVARYANRVNVMYAGKIREMGTAIEIYGTPKHPYTVGLLNTVPQVDGPLAERLAPIEGEIPDLANLPAGCAFQPRCRWAVEKCGIEDPPLTAVSPGHVAACWEHELVNRQAVMA